MTATINDTTVTINSSDVLPQVLRMTDYKKNRLIRTCPTMLDKYQTYSSAAGTINSPLNGFATAMNVDEVANGAFSGFEWTNAQGQPLATAGSVTDATGWVSSAEYPYPALAAGVAVAQGTVFQLYCRFTSCEKLVLSPFVFSDIHEWDTGLFGCQNIQLVMNLQAPSRVLRSCPSTLGDGTLTAYDVQYNTSASNAQQACSGSVVNLQFLTPSLDVPLPPKSVVPYMEFPRYISGNLGSIPAKSSLQVSSQTITLPQIPDLIIIYAKPVQGYVNVAPVAPATAPAVGTPDLNQGDWMFPITKVSVNFDNFAGLLSAHTQQQLYKMTVHNGLEMDWSQWSGLGYTGLDSGVSGATSTPLVGGMLVLKPGRDIVLQAGQAPSLVGNFVLQFNITLANTTSQALSPQLYVITANSGFFETIKGSSRVIKGVLTEQDIISAPVAPGGTTGALRRAVGGNILGSLGNALSRVKGMFMGTPAMSKVANEMGKMGSSELAELARTKGRKQAQSMGHGSLQSRLM